jgi:hypothetical protein
MTDDDLKPLRDALIRCCEDYNVDQAIRAMASALTTLLIGATADQASALAALEKLVKVMLAHIEEVAPPPNISQH